MTRELDPKVIAVLKEYGFGKEAVWNCHGTWIVYHKYLEQIAAKAGIAFDQPHVLEANGAAKVAAICVTGTLNDKTEWSIGEAAPGNNKNSYPFAMAEKRGKDRVILKLIGLHGLAYSEEEADDFKEAGTPAANAATLSKGSKSTYLDLVRSVIDASTDATELGEWWNSDEEKSNRRKYGLDESEINDLKQQVIAKRDALTGKKAA